MASKSDGVAKGKLPKDILCFGTDWYSPSKVSIRQIVDEFHFRGSRVLWINPIPVRFPNTRKKDFWNKVQTKAKTHTRFLKKMEEGVYVYSPIYLPLFNRPGFLINKLVVSLQVLLMRLFLGMRRPLVMGSSFTAWFGLPSVRGLHLIFHFADKISSFREVADQPDRRIILEQMENDIVQAALLCTCSSRSIYDHVAKIAGTDKAKVLYFPHAVDGRLFFNDLDNSDSGELPEEISQLSGPIAGYFGSLTATNDQETFISAAKALPSWDFVFIGRVSGDYSNLESLPNVHFLGPKSHKEIPAYGAAFDVCFMGWKDHEWIQNCFPLKTLEYLALQKPVVCSCQIDEITERFSELVRTTRSASEFIGGLQEEMEADGPNRRVRRLEAVLKETWAYRVEDLLEKIQAREGSNDV